MAAPKPGQKRLNLAKQALPKSKAQRSAAERRAVRLTRAWRQAHPNWNKKGGGGATTSAGDPTALLTTKQIGDQSLALAQGDIQLQQQGVEREKTQLTQQGLQQEHLIGNLTNELGDLTAGIAPSIQTAYRQAASDQAGFAQGFSSGMEGIASAEAARNAAQLEQLGAPQQQIANIEGQGAGAGDVLYGQGGYLPATSLGQQGAAMEAFGAQMPGIVARMGQQDVADVSANTRAGQKALADRAADIAVTLPSLRRQYVQTLLGNEMDKMSLNVAMQQLGLDAAKTGADIAYTQAQTGALLNPTPDPLSPSEIRQRGNDKKKYRENIGKAAADVLGQMIDAHRPQTSTGGPATGVLPSVGADGSVTKTPDVKAATKKVKYSNAFKRIYAAVKLQYGTAKGGWNYGYKDAQIRALIRNYLIGNGINPPRPIPSYGVPRYTPGETHPQERGFP